MANITSSLNYTPKNIQPDLSLEAFNPEFKAKQLSSLNPTVTENKSGLEEYQAWKQKNKKIDLAPVRFSHDQYKRYTDSFFGNTIFLDPRYYNNEEINAQRQGNWEALAMGSIKALPMAWSSFASFFTSTPWNYDNENTRELDRIIKNWEDLFPNFYSEAETNRHFLLNAIPFINDGWGNFWGDKMIKNLGFMGGAFAATALTDAVITATTAGLGTIPAVAATSLRLTMMMGRLGKGFKGANVAARILAGERATVYGLDAAKLANLTLKESFYLSRGAQRIGKAKSAALNLVAANGEASIEAVGGNVLAYEEAFNDFRLRTGRLPTAEEERIMKEFTSASGNIRYGFNLATIWAANMVQFGNLFSRPSRLTTGLLDNSWEKGISRQVGKNTIIDPLTGVASLKEAGKFSKYVPSFLNKDLLADSVSEGMQEIMQFSFEKAQERTSSKHYDNFIEGKYDPKTRYAVGDIITSQVHGMKEAFSSQEGWESFFIGFLTGYPIAGTKAFVNKIKGKPTERQVEQKSIDAFNEANIADLFINNEEIRTLFERDKIAFDELAAEQWISLQLKEAEDNGDIFNSKTLKLDSLINLVRTGVQLGKFDARLVQLESLKNLKDEAFTDTFGLEYNEENEAKVNKLVSRMMEKAEQIKEVVETVDNSWENPFSRMEESMEYAAFENLKENFIRYTVQIDAMADRLPKVVQDILIAQPNLSTDILNGLSSPSSMQKTLLDPITEKKDNFLNTYNSIVESLNQGGLTSPQRADLKKQLKDTKEKLDRLESYIKEISEAVVEYNTESKKTIDLKTLENLPEDQKEEAIKKAKENNQIVGNNLTVLTKNLLEKVLLYKINEDSIDDITKTLQELEVSKLDGIMKSIMDMQKLKNSIGLMMTEQKSLRTPEGQREYVRNYVKKQKFDQDVLFDGIQRASYKELAKNPKDNADAARAELVEDNKELEELNQIKEELERELALKEEELRLAEEEVTSLEEEGAEETESAQLRELQEALNLPVETITEEETTEETTEETAEETAEETSEEETTPIDQEEFKEVEEITDENASEVVLSSGLTITEETAERAERGEITAEEAEEIVEENNGQVIDTVVEEEVSEEEVDTIAEEQNIEKSEARGFLKSALKQAISSGINSVRNLGKFTKRILNRLLKFLLAGGLVVTLAYNSSAIQNKVSNSVRNITENITQVITPTQDTLRFETSSFTTTSFMGCAAYIQNQIKHVIGETLFEKLSFVGHAWTAPGHMVRPGNGTYIYNVFQGQKKPALETKEEITAYIKERVTSSSIKIEDLQEGDIISLFYEGSEYTEEAYRDGIDIYTSHIGMVKRNTKGELVLEHNISGVIKQNSLKDLVEFKLRSSDGLMGISAVSRPNFKKFGLGIKEYTPNTTNESQGTSKEKPSTPVQSSISLLALLALIRRKKGNGEALTVEERQQLESKIKELSENKQETEETKVKNSDRIEELKTNIIPTLKEEIEALKAELANVNSRIKALTEQMEVKENLVEQLAAGNTEYVKPEVTTTTTVENVAEELEEDPSTLATFVENLHETYVEEPLFEIIETFDARDNLSIFIDKMEQSKQELHQVEKNIVSNIDLLTYLHFLIENSRGQKTEKEKDLLRRLKNIQYEKGKKKNKKATLRKEKQLLAELRQEIKTWAKDASEIQNRIYSIMEILETDKTIARDISKKIEYYNSVIYDPSFNETNPQKSIREKLDTLRSSLRKINNQIEETETLISKIKAYLKEIVREIAKVIPLFKNYEKYFTDYKIDLNKLDEEFDSKAFNDLRKRLDNLFEHEEIDSERLEDAEKLLNRLRNKSLEIQDQIRYLEEMLLEDFKSQEELDDIKVKNFSNGIKEERENPTPRLDDTLKDNQDIIDTNTTIQAGTQTNPQNTETQLTQDELLSGSKSEDSSFSFAPYSYMKTTQYSNLPYIERIQDKSGIFEQFLSKYQDKSAFENFVKENNLSLVMMRVPADQGLQDGKYFSDDPKYAPKDSDSVLALVYNDKEGNPTKKIALIYGEGDPNSTDLDYEVIPFEEAFSGDEMNFERGDVEDSDTPRRIVSILQSVKAISDSPSTDPGKNNNRGKNKEFENMAKTRVFLGLSEDLQSAKAYLLRTKKEMKALRDRIATNDEIIPLEIRVISPGANNTFSFSKKGESGTYMGEFEGETHAEIMIPRDTSTSDEYTLYKGKPYLTLKNSSGNVEHTIPIILPSLDKSYVAVEGKTILENLADILFLLQEDYEANHNTITDSLRAIDPELSINDIFSNLIYKPNKEEKGRKIVLQRTKLASKDSSGKPLYKEEEWVVIGYNFNKDKGVNFMSIQRYKAGQNSPTSSLKMTFKGATNKAPSYTKEKILQDLKYALKGVNLNVPAKYTRPGESFHYPQITINKDNPDGGFDVNVKTYDNYISFLGEVKAYVPIVMKERPEDASYPERGKGDPYHRIGKGIIFEEKGGENIEERLEKEADIALEKALENVAHSLRANPNMSWTRTQAKLVEENRERFRQIRIRLGYLTPEGSQKGEVSEERLADIANKVKNQEELSGRENAIFTYKTAEINNLIASNEQQPTSNQSDIEAKKAEIERERASLDRLQDLNNVLSLGLYTVNNSNHIIRLDINGNVIDHGFKDENGDYKPNDEASITNSEIEDVRKQQNIVKKQIEILNSDHVIKLERLYKIIGKDNLEAFLGSFPREYRGTPNLVNLTSYLLNNGENLKGISNEINAKYDAELKALEDQSTEEGFTSDKVMNEAFGDNSTQTYLEDLGITVTEVDITPTEPSDNSSLTTDPNNPQKGKKEEVVPKDEQEQKAPLKINLVKETTNKKTGQKVETSTEYTVTADKKILNKHGTEVFKTESVNRTQLISKQDVANGEASEVSYTPEPTKKTPNPKEEKYIVYPDNTIISTKTWKEAKWPENDGKRKAILGQIEKEDTEVTKTEVATEATNTVTKQTLNIEEEDTKAIDVDEINNLIKGFDEKDGSVPLDSSKALEPLSETKPTEEDIRLVESILEDVNIRQLYDIANSNAYATWTKAAITLYKGATREDLFHEAWHHFSQLYLTIPEKIRLYNEIRYKQGDKIFTTFRGEQKTFKEATDLEIEEWTAREFSKYTSNPKGYDFGNLKDSKSIFKKIWNFIKSLFGAKNNSPENLFKILYKGEIKNYKKSTNNIMESLLNSSINNNFTVNESEKILEVVDGLLAFTLGNKGMNVPLNLLSNTSPEVIDIIYKNTEKRLKVFLKVLITPQNTVKKKDLTKFENLKKLLENWEEVKKFHFNNSDLISGKIKDIVIGEDGIFVDKDNDESTKHRSVTYDFSASERSFYQEADPIVVEMIRLLPEVNKNNELVLDKEYGTPKLIDGPTMVTILLETLSGTLPSNIETGENSALQKLEKLAIKYPTIRHYLIPQIFNTVNEEGELSKPSVTKFVLKTQFFKAFLRPKNTIVNTMVNRFTDELEPKALKPEEYTFNIATNTNTKFSVALNEMKTAFFFYEPKEGDLITQTELGENVIEYSEENILRLGELSNQAQMGSDKDARKLLSNLGLDGKLVGSKLSKVDIAHMFANLSTKLEKTKKGVNDIISTFQAYGSYPEVMKMVESMLEKDPTKISNSYFNAKGKLENEITQWSGINFLAAAINKYDSYQELIETTEFSYLKNVPLESNGLLQMYYSIDKKTFGKKLKNVGKIEVNNKNGILTKAKATDSQPTGETTKSLHIVDLAINDIQSLMKFNSFPTMQLSDKSSFYSVKLPKKYYTNSSIIPAKVFDLFEKHILQEIETVREYRKQELAFKKTGKRGDLLKLGKLSNNIKSDKGKYQFGIFKDIFTDEKLVDELLNKNFGKDPSVLIHNNKQKLTDALVTYFNNEIDAFIKYGENQTKMGEAYGKTFTNHIRVKDHSPEGAVASFYINTFLFNIDTSQLLFGNTYSHKDPFKRISGGTSTGTPPILDNKILEEYKELDKNNLRENFIAWYSEEFGIPLKALQDKRTEGVEGMKELNFIVLKDPLRTNSPYNSHYSSSVDREIKALNELLKDKGITEENSNRIKNKIKNLQEKKKAIEKGYSKFEEPDGFAFMSMDFFRKSASLMGFWGTDLNKIHSKSVSWGMENMKLEYLQTKLSLESSALERDRINAKILETIEKRDRFSLTEEELYKVEFTVQKLQYFGDVRNQDYNEVAMHKFSVMPLIPQLIAGKELQKHAERMLLEDIDYALFDSGNKLEKDSLLNEFYEENESTTVKDIMNQKSADEYAKGENTYNKQVGNLMYLKEQVKMDTQPHRESILFGTQIRVLLFNYFDKGEVDTGNKEFDKEVFRNYEEYKKHITTLIDLEADKLYKQMGISKGTYEILDKEKFTKFIKQEMKNKNVAQNAYEYFELTPAGEFRKDIDLSLYKVTMEKILISVLNNRLISQKMKGEQKVQVPSTGFQSYRKSERKPVDLDNGTNGLRTYSEVVQPDGKTTIRKMQVKIALKGEFLKLLNLTHSDGKPIKTRERLNEEIRNGRIDSKAITMVGYRIPTQEHNSIEIMEVEEFMDSLFGTGIVVPSEIVAKSGSDFDIDKMNVFYPNLDRSGSYLSSDYLQSKKQNFLNEILEEAENTIEDYYFRKSGGKSGKFLVEESLIKAIFSENVNMDYSPEEIEEILYELTLSNIGNKEELIRKINNLLAKDFESKFKKELIQNQVTSIIEKMILNPVNFINLVTPNATFLFDDTTESLIRRIYGDEYWETGKDGKGKTNFDVKLTKQFSYLENLKKFETLMEQKEALGITAKSNVFSQLLRQADVRMVGFDSKFQMDLDENDNIYLGSDTNLAGAQKAGVFGQTINFNVDAANSPIFAYLNTGMITAPIMMFMHHAGVPQDTILTFVNTPIIRRYSNDIKLSKSGKIIDLVGKDEEGRIKILKPFDEIERTIVEELKNLGFNELENSEGESFDIEDLSGSLEEDTNERIESIDDIMKDFLGEITPYRYSTKFLEDHIDRYNRYSTLSPKEKMIYNLEALQLLDQFVLFEKKAALIKMLQDGVSYDTKKALSPAQAYEIQENFSKVKALKQFINIERLRRDSVTTPFAIQEDMLGLISSILPLTNSREFIKFTADKLGDEGDLRFLNSRLKDRFRREFPSGFIQYIFQTMQSPESIKALSMVMGVDLGEGRSRTQEQENTGIQNYYEGDIKPEPNTIFVFGSNPEGRHGTGSAKEAMNKFGVKKFKEIIGGKAHGLVTKDLASYVSKDKFKQDYEGNWFYEGLDGREYYADKVVTLNALGEPLNEYYKPTNSDMVKNTNIGVKWNEKIPREIIIEDISNMYQVALNNPSNQYKVAYRTGSNLNGYTHLELIDMFNEAGTIPSNVIFSKEWVDTGKLNISSETTSQQAQQNNSQQLTFQQALKNFHKDFYKTLVLFKRNNPAMIEKYTLLSNLFINTSNINDTIKSIGLVFQGTDASIINNYINQWRELMEEPGYIVAEDPNSLPIRQFMEQLGLFAFLQSGLGFSNLAFTRVIGSDTLTDNIAQTKQNLLDTIAEYGWESILEDYFEQFKGQNSSFRSSRYNRRTKTTPSSPKNNTTKTESHRLQSYEQRELTVKESTTNTNKGTNTTSTNSTNSPKSTKAIDADWKYTFTYKGKTIKTEFQLSEDQTEALEKLIEFKSSENSSIVLQGPAGTGKTSLIGYLQKYLDGENFLYTAPTHAATVELAFATMKTGNRSLPLTVASSLNTDRTTKRTILSNKARNKLGFGNTIVVDEASMMNSSDYTRLKELAEDGYKIIYLGDKKQIPEVTKNKNLSKDISKAFTENETINLDIIHRTSNNNIKNILQRMRDSIVFKLFKLKENTKNIQFFTSDLKFEQELKKYMLAEPEDTMYIAYTNRAVQSMNKRVREGLFKRTGEIKEGDIIMGYLGYKSKQIDQGNLANSVPFTVKKVTKTDNGYSLEFSSERLNSLKEQGFDEIPDIFQTTYLPLSNKESLENVFSDQVYEENNNYLSGLFSDLYKAYTKALASNIRRDWASYYSQHEALSRTMSSVDLGADYIYNVNTNRFEQYDKNNPSDKHKALKEKYKFGSKSSTTIFEVEKGIDYGHAITIHKSQGKSIKNVFFGANTIIEADIVVKEKGKQISTERQSLVYVGMSRASLNLFVNQGNLPFEELDNLPEQEEIQETSEESNIQGENISSRGSDFAKKLTNVGNKVGLTYKGKKYVNSEHAYQTWKSGEFNQAGYNLKGGKVREGKIGDTFSIMTDILTEKLKQHPDLIEGIEERGGLEYLEKSTHDVIGDEFWESSGQNKFIESLVQAYKNVSENINENFDASKESVNKGFQGYKGGFENIGKGTPQGDGKDKAMRKIADGFIGEIQEFADENSDYYIRDNYKIKTSSGKSADVISNKNSGVGVEDVDNNGSTFVSPNYQEDGKLYKLSKESREEYIATPVIMLARNSEFNNKPLQQNTKDNILKEHNNGAEFIVGDMPNVDSQFIDYLQEINANFTIYHTGSQSRIKVNNNTNTNGQLSLFDNKDKELNWIINNLPEEFKKDEIILDIEKEWEQLPFELSKEEFLEQTIEKLKCR